MESFRKAREEEEANRAIRAAKKQQEEDDAEEVRKHRHSRLLLLSTPYPSTAYNLCKGLQRQAAARVRTRAAVTRVFVLCLVSCVVTRVQPLACLAFELVWSLLFVVTLFGSYGSSIRNHSVASDGKYALKPTSLFLYSR